MAAEERFLELQSPFGEGRCKDAPETPVVLVGSGAVDAVNAWCSQDPTSGRAAQRRLPTVCRSDKPLLCFGEFSPAFFVAVDRLPSLTALIGVAEVVGTVPHDRTISFVKLRHPRHLRSVDASNPERDAADGTPDWAWKLREGVESNMVGNADNKVADEKRRSGHNASGETTSVPD